MTKKKTKQVSNIPELALLIIVYFIIIEDAQETPGAAGGLEDDDVWGDVEDVSKNFKLH